MKKIHLLSLTILTLFVLIYSCSAEEEDTSPPPALVQPQEPQPDPTQYTLKVNAGEGGKVSTEGGTYDEGTQVTITASPVNCYNFTQWSDGVTSSERIITLDKNFEITANFESSVNETV